MDCGHRFGPNDEPDETARYERLGFLSNSVICPKCWSDGLHIENGDPDGDEPTCITGDVTHALTHEGADASEDGTGRGTPVVVAFDTTRITSAANYSNPKPGGPCHPLAAGAHPPAIAPVVAPTLSPGAHNAAPGLNGQDAHAHAHALHAATGVPRRLTPRECERLQGWPDDHTLVPYNGKPLSDSARYKACGNGVASVHSHWIGWRLRLALEAAYV